MSTLLFKHVNVVDVRNQQILSDVDVLIKNERNYCSSMVILRM